jgi:outer membrane receptor protein involved in Fe transport
MERPELLRGAGCLLLLWVLCAKGLSAQSVDTGVLGAITDGTGALIPGAAISVTNQATGVKSSVVSGQDGAFELRYLVPGDYVLEATLDGFRTERRTFQVRVAQLIRIDIQLSVGGQQESVEVVATGQLLETQSGVTGNVVGAKTITNLPLSGRNFTTLGNLTAGVVASGTQFRASGARGMYQQVSFDGVSATNNRGNNLFMYPSVDAVEEFKVQSTNYTAEYGGHAGANVQLQLKSGTNNLRGTIFEFYRNDALDARNYFTPAPTPKPELERHQYGGVLGGPLKRGRTFFMVSYEKTDDVRETFAQTNVITDAMKGGDFSAVPTPIVDPLTGIAFPGNIIPANRLDPTAVALLDTYQPSPNQIGVNNLRGVTLNDDQISQVITRVDHVLSTRQKIFGHYLYQGRDNPTTPINPNFPVARLFDNHSMGVQHVTTWSSGVLNEVRFGYMRGDLNRLSPRAGTGFAVEEDLGISGMLVGGPNGRPPAEFEVGFPTINIQGFNGFGDSTGGEAIDKSQTYQVVDTLTVIRGRHALKGGADIRRLAGDATSVNAPYGALDFTRDIAGHAAAAFMLGYPRTARTPEGIPIGGIRQWRYGFYVQDDWRVSSRLTLNLGLRYDHNTVPVDTNGVSRTLRFDLDPAGPVLFPEPGQVVEEGLYVNLQRHWAPRLGAAYRLTDSTVLRGGYGVFNMALHLDNINTLGTNPPNASVQVTNPTLNPVATLSNPLPPQLLPTNTIFNVTSAEVDRNHQDGYYENWNVAVGHEFSPSSVIEVRYVGSSGHNLDSSLTNFNSPEPDPGAGTVSLQSRRPYPEFGRIRMWVTDGESRYHSFQSEYKQRGPWGLDIIAAYTLSRLRDNQQGGLNASRARRQNPRSLEGEWGISADDQRHRLVVGYVWDIPWATSLTGVTGVLLGGWQLSGIATFHSGSPIFINQDGDPLNVDSEEIRPNLVSGQDPNLPSSDRTILRWFNVDAFSRATVTYGNSPRNPVVGPGRNNVDMSLAKSFGVGGARRLLFRWDVFNAFNTVNWNNPNGTLGNVNFGRITSALAGREMQLSAKFLF